MIFIALKFGKTFYLSVALHPTDNLKNQDSCYDGENSNQNYPVGVFPAVRENLHVTRGVALLLRDHAGDRQLVKQPRRHYPDPFPRKSGTSGDLHLETIKSFNEVA